jgi:hypothetical protein
MARLKGDPCPVRVGSCAQRYAQSVTALIDQLTAPACAIKSFMLTCISHLLLWGGMADARSMSLRSVWHPLALRQLNALH